MKLTLLFYSFVKELFSSANWRIFRVNFLIEEFTLIPFKSGEGGKKTRQKSG
jgi:hypothetical protein